MAVIYPKGNQLAQIVLDGFEKLCMPEVITFGNPMKIKFADKPYNIYLKCISWKGKPYPLNDTRAQLPSRSEFDAMKESKDRFLFLGYDPICDVIVCWNPVQVKSRLNKSSYVSFYSKKNLQEEAKDGAVVTAQLSNGDKFVIFRRNEIASFLSMIEVHFPELPMSENESCVQEPPAEMESPNKVVLVGMISDIKDDPDVQNLVDSLIPYQSSLKIVAECFNRFGNQYFNMKFQNWASLISSYIDHHDETN